MTQLTTDGYRNLASGMTRGKSKREAGSYVFDYRSDAELSGMYRSSWVAKRIVDIPANDSTRRWRSWSADKDDISKIEAEEKRLMLPQMTRSSIKLARLCGVGMLYMSVDDGLDRREPLRIESIRQGSLKRLASIPKTRLRPGDVDEDPDSEFYGRPREYTHLKTQEVIHASRFAMFRGELILDPEDRISAGMMGWDSESVLGSCYDAVRDTDAAMAAVAEMLQEAKVDILKVPDLMMRLATDPAFADQIIERMQLSNMMKGVNNALLMDSLEDLTTKTMSFGGVSEVLEKIFQIPCGASEIPMTRFWGRSPGGLNSTGESDMRLYYDVVSSSQSNDIGPALEPVDRVMLQSLFGSYNDAIIPSWRPLWAPNENERAELGKKIVDIGKVMIDSRMASEDVVGQAVTNALIEYEVIPGLETAMDELGRIDEEAEAQEKALAAALAAQVAPTEGTQPANEVTAPQLSSVAADAEPMTLYISRRVLNATAIIRHYAAQGVEGLDPADELHVTLCYSRARVDWMKMPEPWQSELIAPAGGPRLHEELGRDTKYGVLLIKVGELDWRHSSLVEAGASHDFPEYQQHITLGKGVNLEGVKPYTGEIRFGPEIWEEVKEKAE